MKEIFNDTEYEDESIVRNKSTRNFKMKSRKLSRIINKIENLTSNVISFKIVLAKKNILHCSLQKENQDIIFKTADKGDGWVITDKNCYWDKTVKGHLLSNVYKEVYVDSDKKIFKNLK